MLDCLNIEVLNVSSRFLQLAIINRHFFSFLFFGVYVCVCVCVWGVTYFLEHPTLLPIRLPSFPTYSTGINTDLADSDTVTAVLMYSLLSDVSLGTPQRANLVAGDRHAFGTRVTPISYSFQD